MFFKKRAVRMIERKIDSLTIEHYAPRKVEILQAIEWMYWQGSISKRSCDKLHSLFMHKCEAIMNNYNTKVEDAMDRDYQSLLNQYNTCRDKE